MIDMRVDFETTKYTLIERQVGSLVDQTLAIRSGARAQQTINFRLVPISSHS